MAAVLACGDGAALSHRQPQPHPGQRRGPNAGRPRDQLDPIAIERAVNEADKRELIDPETLRSKLAHYAGEPGTPLLRSLLDKRTFRLSDSDLEIFFRPIAARAGLPPPLSKQIVNGWEVDFFWPELGLVVETDGCDITEPHRPKLVTRAATAPTSSLE